MDAPGLCVPCVNLLRWVRGYFAHVPNLAPKITPETRFVEDLGVDSLDWMHWSVEAEEKLGIVLSDRQLQAAFTVGLFLRRLREAGANWPHGAEVRLSPRPRWWSPYRWHIVKSAEN